MYRILFELTQEYYLPGFLPIYKHLVNDPEIEVCFHVGPNQKKYLGIFLVNRKTEIERRLTGLGLKITNDLQGFDGVICGTVLKNPQKYGKIPLFNVDHGPGFKTLRYREFLRQKEITYHVFVEGQYRVGKFQKYGLDKIEVIHDVGLPKLDPFFNGDFNREDLLREYQLDPEKKTVLYAPSYKPTSLFEAAKTIHTLLDDYNVIVKLHPYSWNGKYAPHSQHRVYEKLSKQYPSLYLAEPARHNMMPFLFVADTLISDGSSVINEFLALGRCGIIYDLDYSGMRHSDGQPLLEDDTREWLTESFIHISNPNDLRKSVEQALNPDEARMRAIERDKEMVFSYTDGKSGERASQIIKTIIKDKKSL